MPKYVTNKTKFMANKKEKQAQRQKAKRAGKTPNTRMR
jgi:hypothetical protein